MPSSFKISRETNNMSLMGNLFNDSFEETNNMSRIGYLFNDSFEDLVIFLQLLDGQESGDEDGFNESYILIYRSQRPPIY